MQLKAHQSSTVCQWQQGCHPPVSKSLLLSPSQATTDQGHICTKQRTSKGREMRRGGVQSSRGGTQTDTVTRIETNIERNKEGGQLYLIRKEGDWKTERQRQLDRERWMPRRKPREMGKMNLWCSGGERSVWVLYRERSCTALMKKAAQLDGEPSVSVSPGGFIITLHS